MRTKSETSQIEPPVHTAQQLEQRRRLCEIVSAPGTPAGETLRELRRLQDAYGEYLAMKVGSSRA